VLKVAVVCSGSILCGSLTLSLYTPGTSNDSSVYNIGKRKRKQIVNNSWRVNCETFMTAVGGGEWGVGRGIKTKEVRTIVSLVSIMFSKTQCHYPSVFSYFQPEI